MVVKLPGCAPFKADAPAPERQLPAHDLLEEPKIIWPAVDLTHGIICAIDLTSVAIKVFCCFPLIRHSSSAPFQPKSKGGLDGGLEDRHQDKGAVPYN